MLQYYQGNIVLWFVLKYLTEHYNYFDFVSISFILSIEDFISSRLLQSSESHTIGSQKQKNHL
jgi:hypothetical protein